MPPVITFSIPAQGPGEHFPTPVQFLAYFFRGFSGNGVNIAENAVFQLAGDSVFIQDDFTVKYLEELFRVIFLPEGFRRIDKDIKDSSADQGRIVFLFAAGDNERVEITVFVRTAVSK